MVGTSADDTDADSVAGVPSCVTIDNVDTVPGVEVVDGTFTVDTPDLYISVSLGFGYRACLR